MSAKTAPPPIFELVTLAASASPATAPSPAAVAVRDCPLLAFARIRSSSGICRSRWNEFKGNVDEEGMEWNNFTAFFTGVPKSDFVPYKTTHAYMYG